MSMRTGHPRTIELVGGRTVKRQVTRIYYANGHTFGYVRLGGNIVLVQASCIDLQTGSYRHWSKSPWFVCVGQ